MAGFIVIVVAICLVGAVAYLSHLQTVRRRKMLTDWAGGHGLRFDPGRDYSINEQYAGFSCLQQGDDRYAYNIISGRNGARGVRAFDFHYRTHSTDSKGRRQTHHHYFSAVILDTELPLKPLFLRAEGFFDKVTEFFGFDDIDFESAEFSRCFYVKSPDRRWAFDVIHQETMEFLLASPRFAVEMANDSLVAWRSSCFGVADFEAALCLLDGIVDRLPESVLRELKEAH